MHNLLHTLFVLALFILSVPSYAESTCGSDTSSNPDVARGKDVWLNGYCKSFLLCRLALEQFHACQAAESFLANLGAEQGVALTEEQVGAAVAKTKQSIGVDATSEKKPMSSNVAMIEFNRVTDMDSKAAALVQSNCGAFACDRLLESTVNPVIREVEALNSNPEYLAHLPKFSPIASVETAGRFGWKKDGAFWVQSGAINASASTVNTSTLKEYLLSKPECRTLHDKLSQEIKTNPTKEPFNLSFFEGECVAQVASYAEDVKNWRALIAAPSITPQVENPQNISELGQWHNNLVAEENRKIAEALEQKRIEAEQLAEHAAAQKNEQIAAAERARQSMSNSKYSSICERNEAKVVKVLESSGYRYYSGFGLENEEKIRLSANLHKQCAGDERSRAYSISKSSRSIVEEMNKELEIHRQNCSKWNADCSRYFYDLHPSNEADSTRNFMQLYRSEVNKALSDPNYSADLEPINANKGATSQSSGDATCEVKFKAIDSKVAAALPNCGASASCNLQAAMWGLSQQISTIESYCPSGKFTGNLSDWRKQLESVTTTCNQIISGGRCEPKL